MNTTIDLFTDAPQPVVTRPMGESAGDVVARDAPGESAAAAVPSPAACTTYPATLEGEPAGDVKSLLARAHPHAHVGATSPAAEGNESSVEQAVTVRGAEGGIATFPADAGCSCGDCGEWTRTITGFGHCEHLPSWTTMSPRAACHFNPSRWVPLSAETIARRAAQAAIDHAADDAESKTHGWSDRALEFIKTFAETNRGKQFIAAEVVVASLRTDLPQPNSFEAWGRPLQQAARRKLIKRVGSHSSGVPLWEAA